MIRLKFSLLTRSVAVIAALGAFVFMPAALRAEENSSPRERLSLDAGWKFHLGNQWGSGQNLSKAGTGSGPANMSFSDSAWRTVNLPHDWAIELPFDIKADSPHGFKALGYGFESNSVGWYRRTLELPKADAGKRLWLEFDGAFRDSTVFVNGWYIGRQESGYNSFRFDITDVANCGGKNIVAVKVDATQFEGWFYEGAGIYRHTWLVKTAPLAIAPDGIFVSSKFKNNMPSDTVEINVETRLLNTQTNSALATVRHEIISPAGKSFAKLQQEAMVPARLEGEAKAAITFSKPELWSPESPKLYRLVTTVEAGGKIVDRKETEFGIRTMAFDPDKGFLLNGKPYVLKGTCNHQDHAGVGAALPDRLQYFRVAKLKEMGDNAYRTSHNPPTPELLEACDRLGMLVMDENRLLGSDAQNLAWLERFIRRDRNHASVVIWSIANEEFGTQGTPAGQRVAATMLDVIERLDSTRPITYAAPVGNDFTGINQIIPVRGWNYHIGTNNMDAYHAAHPQQPNVGTEQGSTVSTRGIYANDKPRGYVSAYDDNKTEWSNTAEEWWSFFAVRPWLSGGFVWTGFDYRGEPTPYWWPCVNSHFGIFDTCGFPKDNFWYYQSWWSDQTVLHLLPHWNWAGKEGQAIDVRALSNCEEVELFLNGESLGRKTMKPNSHLRWSVNYTPGTLSAKGYRGGKVIVETKVETTGVPAAVQLTPDRATINADGADISIVTVAITDAQGRVVPTASSLVRFDLEGPGKILGVGNGDPSSHEPDVFVAKTPFRSVPISGWKWKAISNPWDVKLAEAAPGFDDSSWAAHDIESMSGPLEAGGKAVFRTHLNVTEKDLASPTVELSFGMIDEDGFVFVNGERIGDSHDWQAAPIFDVKRLLHPGENVIAVAVANFTGAGGVNKGANLVMQEKPDAPQWQRSVFNGLAQVIVQSTSQPGKIILKARGAGAAVGQVEINVPVGAVPPAR